jgi:hypothetical protein
VKVGVAVFRVITHNWSDACSAGCHISLYGLHHLVYLCSSNQGVVCRGLYFESLRLLK